MVPISDSLTAEIWSRAAFYGIRDITALSKASGISYAKLRDRMAHPERFTLEELRQLHVAIKIAFPAIEKAIEKGRY